MSEEPLDLKKKTGKNIRINKLTKMRVKFKKMEGNGNIFQTIVGKSVRILKKVEIMVSILKKGVKNR